MQIDNLDPNQLISEVKNQLAKENCSAEHKNTVEKLITVLTLFINRFSMNSRNSSKPPSSDSNRKRGSHRKKSNKKPGGQKGHRGKHLALVKDPDEIQTIKIDRRQLPSGKYCEIGYQSRQVINLKQIRLVIEYRAQVLENQLGQQFVAPFPKEITRPVQYGAQLKAIAVYMSQFQLLPYHRVADYFRDQLGITISQGSLFNFNQEAFKKLVPIEATIKKQLTSAEILNCDETGVIVDRKRWWLHSACNEKWSYFYPHLNRGKKAMDAMNILPHFKGVASHDHWSPYYLYPCRHSNCNAHHLRELAAVVEQNSHQWAQSMINLLLEMNQAKEKENGELPSKLIVQYRRKYRYILKKGSQECPASCQERRAGQRGRIKQSKARNLLERLIKHQKNTLRFLVEPQVPFTNNQSENDLRMVKVQQKISGCFRSMGGAHIFCRIRGFLLSCRKHKITATHALSDLFQNKFPNFITESMKCAE